MRIILADPNQKTLWALRTLLDEEPGMDVIGEAGDEKRLLGLAETFDVDLILLDSRLPGRKINTVIAGLHLLEPRPVVVVMSSRTEDGRYMLKAGADAFSSKGERPDWLLNVLRDYARRMPADSSVDSK